MLGVKGRSPQREAEQAEKLAPESRLLRVVEVLAIVIASLVLSVGLIVLASGYFAGRDQPGVSGTGSGPGLAYADLGHRVLRPGERPPAYDSNPPTSGAHAPASITRDGVPLSNDQLLEALQLGDIVIFYGTRQPPAGLQQFARSVAPPFSAALAAVGETVIIAPRAGTLGLTAAAWTHLLSVGDVSDPRLREFVGFWLGHGAPGIR
jgi:hypothetical protein